MTPHDDRHTSQATVPRGRGYPAMTATAFSRSGQVALRGENSIRRQDMADYGAKDPKTDRGLRVTEHFAIRIIWHSSKQNSSPPVGVRGAGNSFLFDIDDSRRCRGRRNHERSCRVS
jgi:hypothetical protein